MTAQYRPVWFITGCSSGLGRELAKAVLDRGWRLVATARDKAKLETLVAGHEDHVAAVTVDVTKPAEIRAAIAEARARFGRIDVLVNNAGYGYASSIEEGEDAKIRAMFDANVFGFAELIRQVLPVLRSQRDGFVVNISSMAGIAANPGTGYYGASKFAVEGISDALAKEVAPLGIKVLVVEPGPFETGFIAATVRSESTLPDYEATVGARLRGLSQSVGTRPGDPARAATAIIAAVTADRPPQRLVLGKVALRNVREKIAALKADVDAWEQTTLDADFPHHRGA